MKTLYIIRGLPGSGKTTLAHKLASVVCEADDYFMDADGAYNFVPENLQKAHDACYNRCLSCMREEIALIAVSNTFTRKWEYKRYIELAKKYGYCVSVIICTSHFNNVHGVSDDTIEKMRERFEY